MSVDIMCVTSSGGLPILSRHKGAGESLPFSIVGSLYGVHMFGKAQNIDISNTSNADHIVVWKEYYDSIILIGISTGCTIEVLNKALECIVQAIILIVGIDEIKCNKNIERLKRELRICYPIIDRLIDAIDYGDPYNAHSSDLIDNVEILMTMENHLLQIVLESYTECVDSVFCCILIHGKIAVATEDWWSLHRIELKLLVHLASIENTMTSKDILVFLPFKSPNVAFRFIAVTISPDVQVCSLCGSTPSLEDIEHAASQCFKSNQNILSNTLRCYPRNFPESSEFSLHDNINGLLLIHCKIGKYLISNLHSTTAKKSSSYRLDILRTFYYRTVVDQLCGSDSDALETYWCSEYHKCHAMKENDLVLCVLYNCTMATPLMRTITRDTLKVLLSCDKQTCFMM